METTTTKKHYSYKISYSYRISVSFPVPFNDYWIQIEMFVAICGSFQRKGLWSHRAPMESILTKEPIKSCLLLTSSICIWKGKGGYENILVVTDSFTKFSWDFPTHNQATLIAMLLWGSTHQLLESQLPVISIPTIPELMRPISKLNNKHWCTQVGRSLGR